MTLRCKEDPEAHRRGREEAKNHPEAPCERKRESSGVGRTDKRPWRIQIEESDVQETLKDFFEQGATFVVERREQVKTGLMAPKEVVSVSTPSGELDGKFILREFPFYTDHLEGYATFATDYQNWLSSTLGMAPRVIPRGGDIKEEFVHTRLSEGQKTCHSYLQVLACAQNAAASFTSREASVCGRALSRFHRAGRCYLNAKPLVDEKLKKTSADVLVDLFGWVSPDFCSRHPSLQEQKYFQDLVDICRRDCEDIVDEITKNKTRSPTIVHGDFNPGNILIDSTGAFQIIDFDDLRVGDWESDVAHFLCQIMVFKFFYPKRKFWIFPTH